MSIWQKAKRAKAVAGIVTALVGSGQAPPPSQMSTELSKQYATYSKEVRMPQTRRDIKRLTGQVQQPVPMLDKRNAKRLRKG